MSENRAKTSRWFLKKVGNWVDGCMDGWVGGWMGGCWSRVKDCLQQSQHWLLEKVEHWMDGWMDVGARLSIAFSNKKRFDKSDSELISVSFFLLFSV